MPKHPLRRWRESHDRTVTLKELAAQLGIDVPRLSRIETWSSEPRLGLLCRLEDITGLHPRSFLRPAVRTDQNASTTTEPSDAV